MHIKKFLLNSFKKLLKHYGLEIIERYKLYDWQKESNLNQKIKQDDLPNGALEYLHDKNPRLKEFYDRYNIFNPKVTSPLIWVDDHIKPEDILYFRADNPYLRQLSGMNIMSYALTTFYVKSIDKLNLLKKLEEDNYFGIHTYFIDDKLISRDLLDSIIEIYFLEGNIKLSSLQNINIIDIGAGYGRLAHRMVCAMPNIKQYILTDAVAVSTFISEYYIKFRKIANKAHVIPLDEIENKFKSNINIDIAININSFTECRLSAIDWWVALLSNHNVRYLMIGAYSGNNLITDDGCDFGKIITKYGYKLIIKRPKYEDPIVNKYAINPQDYFLFKLF